MRRLLFLILATGLTAATVVALASASHSAGSISPSAEVAWPWEPKGSIPAGTSNNNWEQGKGDHAGSQFSYLKQINTSNVANLKVAWTQNLAPPYYTGGIQGSPIVVTGKGKNLPLESGTMFVSADKGIVALDPTNGKILWKYVGPPPKPNSPGGTAAAQLQYGNTTKSIGFCDGKVTTGQQDGSIAAINAKTGAPLWSNQVSAVAEFAGHTGQTSPVTDCAPGVGPNGQAMVFGGPNGSSSPLRGHMDGIDLTTGKLIWRWFTTPDPTQLPFILTWGNPAEAALGGGGTWGSSAIDPALHIIYSETGNAYAQLGRQPGINLWTTSSFALDTRTGALKWYFQESHHDNWDHDHSTPPILPNVKIDGKVYPAFISCDKPGNCEVLDRRNGRFLPHFPMKEESPLDPSGKGRALNNEPATQPVNSCVPGGNFFAPGATATETNPVAKGAPCAMANITPHCPTNEDAARAYPTFPVAPNGDPMQVGCTWSSTYAGFYTVYPYCSGCVNYNRSSYSPLTNNYYVCAQNSLSAQENVSPTDWHRSSIGGPTTSVWLSAVNMANNTMSWQDRFWGATYVNGVLTGGVNPGFTQGAWSHGCDGGIFTTAGNLLFIDAWSDTSRGSTTNFTNADRPWGGTLAAFNATTGEGPLWTWQAPAEMNGSAITYSVNGKQYVAIYHRLPVQGSAQYNGHGEQLTVFTL
jgi:glucose dehydrogenase